MKESEYFFPIQEKCTVKGCKNKPEIGLVKLTGTHPMNMRYSGFACLCKEHKNWNDEHSFEEPKGLVEFIEKRREK
jgi:hypothetical protein